MWPRLVKIQYTEIKLCGNDPAVKNYIYSNGDLDLWHNDPKINMVLPRRKGNHVAKFSKDPIYRTKIIVRNLCGHPPAARRPSPAIPNHIIRAYKKRKIWNGHLLHAFFWQILDIAITDHNRPVKDIYCLDPYCIKINKFIYIILQHVMYWSVTQYLIKSTTLACSGPYTFV